MDLAGTAARVGAPFMEGSAVIVSLGKEFWINSAGDLGSDIHQNNWMHLPLLHYLMHGKGLKTEGRRLTFGDLKGTGDWQGSSRTAARGKCGNWRTTTESRLRTPAPFQRQRAHEAKQCDHSLLSHSSPKPPFLINSWGMREGFETKLQILFDWTAPDNVIIVEALYLSGRGLVDMFRTLMVRHCLAGKLFSWQAATGCRLPCASGFHLLAEWR